MGFQVSALRLSGVNSQCEGDAGTSSLPPPTACPPCSLGPEVVWGRWVHRHRADALQDYVCPGAQQMVCNCHSLAPCDNGILRAETVLVLRGHMLKCQVELYELADICLCFIWLNLICRSDSSRCLQPATYFQMVWQNMCVCGVGLRVCSAH